MSTLEQTMREAFERFATNSPMGSFCVTTDTRPGRAGGYWSSHTQLMWDSWKAAWSAALDAGQAQPVATVTECEACFTPDVCQLRGTCDHYSAERLRVASPPARQPLTDEAVSRLRSEYGWAKETIRLIEREVLRAHGIT